MKRLFDLVASFAGILLLSPVFCATSILLLVTQGRPLFFGQVRVGRFGVPFTIWKLRTMVPNASTMGLAVTARDDNRITPLGRLLRRTKLDELPQLWNVFLGEMSFVGPRPEVPKYVAMYDKEQRRVLELKPGITDMATLAFVDEEDLLAGADDKEEFYVNHCLPKKIALNLEYAARATLWSDIVLVAKTVMSLVCRTP